MTSPLVIKPAREDWRLAREVHSRFATKVGSQFIASEYALAHLAAVVRTHPVESVLEFGSGIGTITYLLLKTLPDEVRIVCVERDAWCRDQFEANIPKAWRERVTLLPNGRPELDELFDLVVVDGPVTLGHCGLKVGSICFGEGARKGTQVKIVEAMKARGLNCSVHTYLKSRSWRLSWTSKPFGFKRPRLTRIDIRGFWVGRVEER